MRSFLLITILLTGQVVQAQPAINKPLKKQLDSVFVLDQKYREMLSNLGDSLHKDSLAKAFNTTPEKLLLQIWKMQTDIDSSNLLFIEKIFSQYGYPGKTLVGDGTNEAAWHVIQHSARIKQYFGLIRDAGQQKELPYRLVAMMEDRQLMEEGKEQLYGTQGKCQMIKTGKFECFIWPIKDPESVNKRRTEAGFDLTVEKNAERLQIKYRVLKLSDIQ